MSRKCECHFLLEAEAFFAEDFALELAMDDFTMALFLDAVTEETAAPFDDDDEDGRTPVRNERESNA